MNVPVELLNRATLIGKVRPSAARTAPSVVDKCHGKRKNSREGKGERKKKISITDRVVSRVQFPSRCILVTPALRSQDRRKRESLDAARVTRDLLEAILPTRGAERGDRPSPTRKKERVFKVLIDPPPDRRWRVRVIVLNTRSVSLYHDVFHVCNRFVEREHGDPAGARQSLR